MFAGWTWNAAGLVITWKPEITFTVLAAMAALLATTTSATRWVGPSTQTRRTAMSLVPNPTVTWPSTKLVSEVLISTIAAVPQGVYPAGKAAGLMAAIPG